MNNTFHAGVNPGEGILFIWDRSHPFLLAWPIMASIACPAMQISPKDVGLILWWIIWFSILSSVLVIHFIIPAPTGPLPPTGPLSYLPLVPLFLGSAVRWLVLPRLKAKEHALAAFIFGLALCESCGILGIFLAPEMRTTYVILAVLGLLQFIPVFAVKFGK